MTVKSGAVWAGSFVTTDSTGAKVNSSVGPSGTLYVNGIVNSAVVSIVTGTNPYKWSVNLPSLSVGDRVQLYTISVISGITSPIFVAEDQADTYLPSDVFSSIGTPIALDGGTPTVVGMLTKFADDSSGSLYDATADSLHAIAGTVGNISIAGAPSYEAPTSYVLSTGTQTGGTYASVDTSNGVYHTHTDSGGLLDLYYQFTLAGDEIATSVIFKGRINTSNDNVNIQAYDWTTSSWSTLFTLVGTNVATDTSQSPALVGKYTGTGLNVGKVRIRIVNAVTLTTATLYVDQLIIGKTITSRTVGYQDGAVWIDTVNGATGTVSWVNGTADNPVKTLAEAYTIASAVGLNAYVLAAGSSITLTQSAANTKFVGAATINLNGQSIADAFFQDSYTINGASTGDDAEFINCGLGSGTFYHAYFIDCRFKGVTTFVASNEYIIIRGTDSTAGAPNTCQFIFDANVDVIFRAWTGGIQLNNLSATNTAILDGAGRIILNSNCSGGSVTVRGFFPPVTDQVVGGFLGTITDTNRYGEDQNTYAVVDGYVTVTGTVSAIVSSPVTVTGYVNVTGTVIVGTNNDKSDYVLSSAGVTAITDDVFAEAVEGTITFRQWLRRMGAVLFGKASGGGVAGSKKFRNTLDSKDRVDAVTDSNGNRTGVSFDDT